MVSRTVIAACAAAAFVLGATLASTGASARGGHGGGAGNWPEPGTWNYPYRPECVWVPVREYHHKRVYERWVERCQ